MNDRTPPLAGLPLRPVDPLLAQIGVFAADPRPTKLDLSVGMARNDAGDVPVMESVKAAERLLLTAQTSKSYLGAEGDKRFVELLRPIIFGAASDPALLRGLQTIGGTGALRMAAELLALAGVRRIWLGTPGWPNHLAIVKQARLESRQFPLYDSRNSQVDKAALLSAIREAEFGDAILLQGCCANPTGLDLDLRDWEEIADALADRGVIPLLDLAYQGLGDGLDEDAAGTRAVVDRVPIALIAYSCDKNFALYRERTGALYVSSRDPDTSTRILSNLLELARANWSMPADHGAAIVSAILADGDLHQLWRSELGDIRTRLQTLRASLAHQAPNGSLQFLTHGKGMFAMLPLDQKAISDLRETFGIYLVPSGRINIAGLSEANIPVFLAALYAVSDSASG